MKKKEVNVVRDILKSRIAISEFGTPVREYLTTQLPVTGPTLFIIDLNETNPIDYRFINIAFSEIINEYLFGDYTYLIFRVNKWELEELFVGISDILKLKLRNGISERQLLIENGFNLITVDDTIQASYLADLPENQYKILNEIEKNEIVSSSKLQEQFSLIPEETTSILQNLIKKKFIYKVDNGNTPGYKSVVSLLKP